MQAYLPWKGFGRYNSPVKPGVPKGKKGPYALVCVVCRKPFERPANLAVKAKVCTPFEFRHEVTYEERPDGTKRIPCGCCRCVYKKTLSKKRTLDGKLIPSSRVQEFLKLSGETYGAPVALAFRLGINAMLRVTELASLTSDAMKLDIKPLPQVEVIALKKKVEMLYKIDIDQETAEALAPLVKAAGKGAVFGMPVRTLQHKFKQIARGMGIGHLSIHALRHTGISIRARSCKTMDELNYVRDQARHESIETTRLYMGFEEQQRVMMAKRIKWV